MNNISKANIKAHIGRPKTPEGKILTLWKPSRDFIHCCIESQGCKYNKLNGSCIMCDYGFGRNVTPEELNNALHSSLLPKMENVTTVLFGSYGSIFDEYEISQECLHVLLSFISELKINTVIFETHCETITEHILDIVKQKLSKKMQIVIEMGYESCDRFILNSCINKTIDLKVLEHSINTIHKKEMLVSLNVFLGAPFLSERDQLNSVIRSIEWAKEKGADSLVLFPANIKPHTLLYHLYIKNYYKPISQWMIPVLLSKLPTEYLSMISFSWYGDRKNFYENDQFPLIPPTDCSQCHPKIFLFYNRFMSSTSNTERKTIVNQILSQKNSCNCKSEYIASLNQNKKSLTSEQIERLIKNIT